MTLYLLVDELTPPGAGTRAFGWLVTANNGGLALGAAVAGEVVRAHGGAAGLWLAAGCAAARRARRAGARRLQVRVRTSPGLRLGVHLEYRAGCSLHWSGAIGSTGGRQ